MGFSAKQVHALRRNLDHRYVRTRESNGRELSYIGGWYAISEANRIFGFDGWNRETIESRCVLARENRGAFTAVYIARVRITVTVGGSTIVREGHGTGEGRGATPGEVHDTALKGAETDATKRALATFGKPFGLSLYEHGKQPTPAKALASAPKTLASGPRPAPAPSPQAALAPLVPSPQPALAPATPSPRPLPAPSPKRVESGRRVSLARDDTTPIPRPSSYYGREKYLETREQPPHNLLAKPEPKSEAKLDQQQPSAEVSIVPDTIPAALHTPEDMTPGRIDKSLLTLSEPKRRRDKAHLRFVASQPCLVCGRQPSDPHHLRFAQPRALGLKVSDEFTVPLCRGHHRQLHQAGNEPAWWEDLEINALEIANGLWDETHGRSLPTSANGANSLSTKP